MEKKLIVALCLCILTALTIGGIVSVAAAEKVDVCHYSGDTGEYIKINISESAFQSHIDHGDSSPGDPVPGATGWVFDEDCLPHKTSIDLSQGVLPIAYACQPPAPGFEDLVDEIGCAVKYGDLSKNIGDVVEQGEPNWDSMMILSFNDYALDLCVFNPSNCDINSDGIQDIFPGSESSVVSLNGDLSVSGLSDVILGNVNVEIYPYTWVPTITGVLNSFFIDLEQREGSTLLVPIFDLVCFGDPEINCPELYNSDNPTPPDFVIVTTTPNLYVFLRIIEWRQFYISCVDRSVNSCPFHEYLTAQGILPPNNYSVEGYFISGSE